MLKSTILVLTAVAALGLTLPVSTTANAAAACGARCAPPPPPPPPPPNNPDPGTPSNNPNNKPADEGPGFTSGGSTNENQMLIACRIPSGDAGDTTNLAFRNIGDKTIPGGTRVLWQVKSTGQSGQFVLTADLPVGKELTAADLLKLGVPAKTGCLSKLS